MTPVFGDYVNEVAFFLHHNNISTLSTSFYSFFLSFFIFIFIIIYFFQDEEGVVYRLSIGEDATFSYTIEKETSETIFIGINLYFVFIF